jgi:hypothetical protein
MSTMTDEIYVKSHVARDLLQSAGLFKSDKLVVWEYVLKWTSVRKPRHESYCSRNARQ